MTSAFNAELLKLRTTRTFAALVASALLLSLLVTVLTTSLADLLLEEEVRELYAADFSGLFIFLLGIMGMAGEWRHRTITSTVLATPDRMRLLAAKVGAYAAAGVVLSLVVTVAIMVAGQAILSSRDMTTLPLSDLADAAWRNLVIAGFSGALGVCIGGIVRNQVVAIVGTFVYALMVEPALVALVPDVGQFGFTSGAPNAILGIDPIEGEEQLSAVVALLVMTGWVGLGFALAGVLLKRRDLV